MKLVDNWKSAWKWLSVQLITVAGAIQLSIVALPDKFTAWIPDSWAHAMTLVVLLGAVLGRLKDQSKPSA
jgi:hypothetical protein